MVTPAIPASAECPAGGAPGERSQNAQYRSCQQGYGVVVEAWRHDHEPQHVVPAISFPALAEGKSCLSIVVCPDECQEFAVRRERRLSAVDAVTIADIDRSAASFLQKNVRPG
jgi:hypothetical protein